MEYTGRRENDFTVYAYLEAILETARVVPAVDQCEHYVGRHPTDSITHAPVDSKGTIATCRSHNITYMAFSPLGPVGQQPKAVLHNPIVKRVAAAHSVSAAAIGLAWVQQQGMVMVTSTDNAAYAKEDLAIDALTLSGAEMAALAVDARVIHTPLSISHYRLAI